MQAANKTSLCTTSEFGNNASNDDDNELDNLEKGLFLIEQQKKAPPQNTESVNNDLLNAAKIGDLEELTKLFDLYDQGIININYQELVCKKIIAGGRGSLAFPKPNRTALHKAVLRNHLEVVKFLLAKGAKTDIADIEGNTPLHLATQSLLNKKSQLLSIDNDNHNNANENISANFFIIELLVDNNANITAKNKQGLTPFDYVKESGKQELIALFTKKSSCIIS